MMLQFWKPHRPASARGLRLRRKDFERYSEFVKAQKVCGMTDKSENAVRDRICRSFRDAYANVWNQPQRDTVIQSNSPRVTDQGSCLSSGPGRNVAREARMFAASARCLWCRQRRKFIQQSVGQLCGTAGNSSLMLISQLACSPQHKMAEKSSKTFLAC